ncbi:carbohydrate ABC transporter permease [Microbacterium oxydans]|jgi:alpha-glucoside transport system permease protein|uniref:L-arabinose transport system permease protein AraQ n=1 Tax=Microbacterium oxydans TaxID=82380 RepID=A0A147E0F3_9MICO|nr:MULTISPECIES: carbohydrate ABC transporter permease [Microbacterium]AZS41556.1 L-arabinose transport system permease protein AraQ [Microbacterium oxydans]KAB1893545.1 carbohydrate ABC transporter permease [Microbacterium oxydans]KKX98341.1 sugar ABC transporter permease [Microbacterium sp. Ag1]KTR76432.1 sugar ABC transporter permease [Microbacterium oxydans]MBE7953526.1 carbohydrate ABC transporter permease [Microbacterium sp. R1]
MTDTVKSETAVSTRAITTGGGIEGSAGRARKKLSRPWASVASIVIAVLWTIPTLGLFISSFRPRDQIQSSGWWTFFADPQVTIENYVDVLQSGTTQLTILESFVNSIAITIPATLVPLMIASMAAYAFAWIDFKGRNALFIFVFALQIVPIQMALVPLLSSFSRGINLFGLQVTQPLGASDGYAQVWIAHTMFALPLAIYLLHNFMSEIPGEIIEAARVDGASRGQIFFRVVLPLTMPAIASVAIFQFLWVWNDLLVGLVFADGAAAPITKLLAEITGTRGNDWYLLTAGAFVSIIVPLIVFFALQRYFVRGLLAGSTKG